MKLSAVIICKNGSKHLHEVLSALEPCDEIIFADTGSTDDSVSIAETFQNVSVLHLEFDGFGKTKNEALSHASNNWILSVDADEVIEPTLLAECVKFITTAPLNSVGQVIRINLFAGKRLKFSRWGCDRLIRLFNKTHTQFSEAQVHEAVEKQNDTKIQILEGSVIHYAVDDPADISIKSQGYNSLRDDKKLNTIIAATIAILKSLARFVKVYLMELSVLDGRYGIILATETSKAVFRRHWQRRTSYRTNVVNNRV